MQVLQQLHLAGPHPGRLLGVGVVVSEDVEDPVDDEEGQLVLHSAGVLVCLSGRDRRADDDVSEQQREVTRIRRRPVGSAPKSLTDKDFAGCFSGWATNSKSATSSTYHATGRFPGTWNRTLSPASYVLPSSTRCSS